MNISVSDQFPLFFMIVENHIQYKLPRGLKKYFYKKFYIYV